jgi:hypothetical protein
MQCMSCGANIPPEWVNAIQSNICPGCGGEIMNGPAKELLDELSAAMARMPNDPQGVAGWLMSNYRLQKVGSGAPTEHFHRQGRSVAGDIDTSNLKIADNPVDQFLGRTDFSNRVKDTQAKIGQMKNNKLAKLAQSIHEEPDPYGFEQRQAESAVEDVSNEDIAAMRAMMNSGMNPFAGSSGGGGMQAELGRALTADEIAAIQSYGQAPDEEAEDLLPQERALAATGQQGREVVLKNRYKRIKAQDAVTGGSGGGGSFWRS